MKIKLMEPLMIFPDVNATHLYPRWWHKLFFWRNYRYPDWKIRTKRVSIEEFLKEEGLK